MPGLYDPQRPHAADRATRQRRDKDSPLAALPDPQLLRARFLRPRRRLTVRATTVRLGLRRSKLLPTTAEVAASSSPCSGVIPEHWPRRVVSLPTLASTAQSGVCGGSGTASSAAGSLPRRRRVRLRCLTRGSRAKGRSGTVLPRPRPAEA